MIYEPCIVVEMIEFCLDVSDLPTEIVMDLVTTSERSSFLFLVPYPVSLLSVKVLDGWMGMEQLVIHGIPEDRRVSDNVLERRYTATVPGITGGYPITMEQYRALNLMGLRLSNP